MFARTRLMLVARPFLAKSWESGVRSNVQFEPLTQAHVAGAIECIGDSFKTGDPFTTQFGLGGKNWRNIAQMFVERAAQKDLSLVAVSDDPGLENAIVGVMINEDWKLAPPNQYRALEEWRPIRAIFNELHTRYKQVTPTRIHAGQVLHPIYFTCVRPEFRKQGIISELWAESVKLAQQFNFTSMVAESSNSFTDQVCLRLGFQRVATVPYDEILFEGKPVFKDLRQHKETQQLTIFERPITSDLFV